MTVEEIHHCSANVQAWPARQRAAPIPLPELRYEVSWARHEHEVREAQRLRYRVFAQEMGAVLQVPAGTPPGHDVDRFDAFCEHLLVRAITDAESGTGPVIGTYRVLPPAAARRAGGLYTETEFDLSPLASLRPRAIELGRTCVHPDWRSGGVITALWGELTRYMARHQYDTMIGCASVGMSDGGHLARQLWHQLSATHLAPAQWHVRPLVPLSLEGPIAHTKADIPPLIKGYLRCGAKVLGPPAIDLNFDTADLPCLMHIADLPARYRRHFLGA